MNATTYGVDIAKNVFQVHWVDAATGEIRRKKLSRAKFVEFFANRAAARIVMEACGGAHHWGRTLSALGHQVELLPPQHVRMFVTGNKDDAADARALWLAAQHGDIRRVPVKSVDQQAALSVHRMRSHWVCVRTATLNSLRGLLYEFGVVLPKGRSTFCRNVAEHRAQIDAQLPAVMQHLLDAQLQALREIDNHIAVLESELKAVLRSNDLARRLEQASGIGLMGSTALAATLGDAGAWRNAREFACCLGLTPRHSGTGGKVRIGGISKRGDAYLRTVLIHGARNLVRVANPPQWIAELLKRRPPNVVATAVANKLARIAWSMAAHGEKFDPHRAFGAKAAA